MGTDCTMFILRYIVLVFWAISVAGIEKNLSKRRCIFSDNPYNLEPASTMKISEHLRRDRSLVSYDQPNEACQQRYVVPVVWHVIIDSNRNGEVSDAILQRQVDILNGAYENTSLVFKMESVSRIINDTWTSDCLANILEFQEILAESTDIKLNLYTCALRDPNVIGHSSYPWSHDEDSIYNGVIIHPGTLPGGVISPINEGDNLVHEVGHYFGLLHTFEGGCEGAGDSVADTPAAGYPTYNCPDTPVDSCPDVPGYDPIHNYMGYNQDSCINHFTPGQVNRIDNLLGQYRKKLKTLIERPCVIDSVFRWTDGYIYFFAGGSYYRYNEISRGIDSGYPRAISDHWRGVPNNIDGVFRYANGFTYFFKGSNYYRYNDVTLKVDPGYPKKIASFWKGIPNNIDDVIRYSNGLTYFFKNHFYYRFNSTTATIDIGYPKKINQYWNAITKKVQAAFTWYNGGVYFFKDSEFWLFVPGASTVDVYPKLVKNWWSAEDKKYQDYNAFRYVNGYTYFISNKQYWRYNDFKNHIDYTYPHPLINWMKLPARIDGLFVWSDGQLYSFSGQYYYQVIFNVNSSQSVTRGNISAFWHGVPNHIDAVFRANDGLTYFFKDSHYYRFNDSKRQVGTGYPKAISSFWKGVPNDVETVFRWSNGQTYFFKENNYYRFNFTKGAVDDGYPRKIAGAWRGVMYHTNSS